MGFRDATKRRFPLDTVLGIVRILEDPIGDAKRLGIPRVGFLPSPSSEKDLKPGFCLRENFNWSVRCCV